MRNDSQAYLLGITDDVTRAGLDEGQIPLGAVPHRSVRRVAPVVGEGSFTRQLIRGYLSESWWRVGMAMGLLNQWTDARTLSHVPTG